MKKESSQAGERLIFNWQMRLMKWMVILPSLLIILFVALATWQLNRFNDSVQQYAHSEIEFQDYNSLAVLNHTTQNQATNMKLYTLAKMEEMAMRKRYSQGGVLLMSRIYIKYLGFFTGMIMAIVGSVFIISKIREGSSSLKASFREQANFTLLSSSPGIVFGVLGTGLMLATILQHTDIKISDMPLYLNHYNLPETNHTARNPLLNSEPEPSLEPNDSAQQAMKLAMEMACPD